MDVNLSEAASELAANARERQAAMRRGYRNRHTQDVPSDGEFIIATIEPVAHGFRLVQNVTSEVFEHRSIAVNEYREFRRNSDGEFPAEALWRISKIKPVA